MPTPQPASSLRSLSNPRRSYNLSNGTKVQNLLISQHKQRKHCSSVEVQRANTSSIVSQAYRPPQLTDVEQPRPASLTNTRSPDRSQRQIIQFNEKLIRQMKKQNKEMNDFEQHGLLADAYPIQSKFCTSSQPQLHGYHRGRSTDRGVPKSQADRRTVFLKVKQIKNKMKYE